MINSILSSLLPFSVLMVLCSQAAQNARQKTKFRCVHSLPPAKGQHV
jgi:hypothetical protein